MRAHKARTVRHFSGAFAAVAALVLAGCGASDTDSAAPGGGGSVSVEADPAIAEMLPADIKTKGKLTVATEGAYPPFELFDTDGKTLIGVDPELATAIAQVMGLEVDLVNVKFDSIIPGLQAKRYDIGMAAFGDTEDREKVVDFVTYFNGGTSLLVPAGNPQNISLDDMCGRSIAIQKGTIYESDVVPHFQDQCQSEGEEPLVESVYPGQPETILAVGNGRADFTMSDYASLVYVADQASGKFEVIPEQYDPIPWGVAVPKGTGMAEPVQAALEKLMADGTYDEILKKWGVESGAIESPEINAAKG